MTWCRWQRELREGGEEGPHDKGCVLFSESGSAESDKGILAGEKMTPSLLLVARTDGNGHEINEKKVGRGCSIPLIAALLFLVRPS